MKATQHSSHPTLSVVDPRALAIRSVAYCQHPDKPDVEPHITRQIFDEVGREVAAWDPRLWGAAPKPNLSTVYALSGQVLLTDSVDAGWQLNLCNDAGSQRSFWDARGSQCRREFDELQRPVALTEQAYGEQPQVVERWTYADATESFAQHNQCGQLLRHDDPGGGQLLGDYGLSGAVLEESRRFLIELDAPDWPLLLDARDELLEEKAYVTRYAFYPTGEVQRQIDAAGNTQIFHFNVAGKSSATWLLQSGEGQHPQCLVSEIRYNAQDQIESETAGNGVVSSVDYSPEDGRLLKLFAGVAGQQPLQDLNYVYDPVGNIVELEDKCQTVSHFNAQRIEPVSRYRYDSLYQMVEAKGWEVSKPSHGPALPDLLPVPLDPAQRRNYTQTFAYDAAGNLITRHHSGAPGFSMFTSARSNRSLAQLDDGSLPGEAQIALGFDAAGNQLELQRGQPMTWNVRNELSRVTLVQRGAEADDFECYVYDQPGHRLRKTQISRASGQTLTTEVRYLPGLEIHCEVGGVERHVVSVDAGRNHARLLHWPEGAESDQWGYSLGDHLGSSSMELDERAGVLSQEHYYAFGGTACWAGKSDLATKYKSVRYSGKERDLSGLYHYGYRYYAPWLCRWINPDPAGSVNGLNLYCFVGNYPVGNSDKDGRYYEGRNDEFEARLISSGKVILARGLSEFPQPPADIMRAQMQEAGSIYEGAQHALYSNLRGSKNVLQSYFGSSYRNITTRLLSYFASGEILARHYQEAAGDGKFIGAISIDAPFTAMVAPADNYGRVVVDMDFVSNRELPAVLAHELSHLIRVDGINVVGAGTMDNFYLGTLYPFLLGSSATPDSITHQDISELILSGGLTVEYMDTFPGSGSDFSRTVESYMGIAGAGASLSDAVSLFNSNPDLRAEMSVKNADSVAYSAKSLNSLYRARQSNGRMFTAIHGN
ncbi:RHS repeat domain-containing protein [Pseudomonas rustica]|uniref:RHS repeat domain-containing protein n=1 Tax=Pseudomonas rustica TaxID=2827099 RepID=UPI001BAF605B|nr:RHS repeat-associated core domain-containing protein [Pseudomonas rustica]MBS4087607.1 M48 family metalloprotease [Pseudomonas rustica]